MRQWIRSWGLILFVAIALLWFLCIDWMVKAAIETVGTDINGALVELESVSVSLWPSQLQLNGLQVADADNPLFNLLQASEITAQLDGLMLLRRQLIIDSASLSGLALNSPRQYSGAIQNSGAADESSGSIEETDSLIPGVSLPNVEQLLKGEEQRLKDDIGQIEQRLKKIQQRWEKNIRQLPDDDRIDDYRARWKKLKKASFLEKLTGVRTLKKDIDKDLDLLSSFDDQLEADQARVKKELRQARELPNREAKRLMSKVGLSTGDNHFMSALLGTEIKQWLQQGLGVFKKITRVMNSDDSSEPQSPPRGEGQWIRFPEPQALPLFLLRRATLDGQLLVAGNRIDVEGKLSDLAYPPSGWPAAATITLHGKTNSAAEFSVNGHFDHRQPLFKDQLKLQITQLPLNNQSLADTAELKLGLQQALVDISGVINLDNNGLVANIDSQFNEVKLTVDNDKPSTTQTIIADTLRSIKNFDLQLTARGDINAPSIGIRSNLDSTLSASLKKQATAQSAKLQKNLQEKLQSMLSGELAELEKNADFMRQLEEILSSRKDEMLNIL